MEKAMGVLLRFLFNLAANLAWQRAGGKGAIPPVKLPKGKRPVNIPVLAPWQMMAAMWVVRKMWGLLGHRVKDTLATSPNLAARQVGTWLPDPPADPNAPPAASSKISKINAPPVAPAPSASRASRTWIGAAQPAPSGAKTAPSAPAAPTPSAPPAPQPTTQVPPRPVRDYGTRRLDDTDGAADAAATPAATPPTPRIGSLLGSLRRGASG
jgi:hypothetical protein